MDETVLEEKGITDIPDVIRNIPNMMISEGVGNAVSFRGLIPSMFTNNNPVVIYIDGVSYAHPSGIYARVDIKAAGETSFYDNASYEFVKEDEYITLDAKIGYIVGNWDLYVYGKNLTDEEYIKDYQSSSTLTMAYFGEPLTVGAGLRYRF